MSESNILIRRAMKHLKRMTLLDHLNLMVKSGSISPEVAEPIRQRILADGTAHKRLDELKAASNGTVPSPPTQEEPA